MGPMAGPGAQWHPLPWLLCANPLPQARPPTHLHRQLVVAVDVVRHGEGDPVVTVRGLGGQQPLPRVHKARQVAHLNLRAGREEGVASRRVLVRMPTGKGCYASTACVPDHSLVPRPPDPP